MNREKVKALAKECDTGKLGNFFSKHKSRLNELLMQYFISDPGVSQKYFDFVLNSEDGKKRVEIYTNNFGDCLAGSVDEFLDDQEQVGNIRATQGYKLEDVIGFVRAFGAAIWECIKEYNASEKNIHKRINFNDVFYIYQIYAASSYLISVSFNQSANDIIAENGMRINMLQRYAAEAVSIFDESKIYNHALQYIRDIFLLNGELYILDREGERLRPYSHTEKKSFELPDNLLMDIFRKMKLSLKSFAVDAHNELIISEKEAAESPVLSIFKPLQGNDQFLLGILVVHSNGHHFKFSQFHQSLLDQFVFFTGAVISNCRMTFEVAEKRQELGELAGHLISIQEEERKKIAAEIHDTLTQTLTGIGYKAYYCRQIIDKYPDKLKDELDNLINNINYSIRQSRQMINSLRPQVLDGVGIIAALTSLVNQFCENTTIDVEFHRSEKISVDSNIEIALFRIVQEALNNIRKHSHAKKAHISLVIDDHNNLELTVTDNGIGFSQKREENIPNGSGLGLLIMRERIADLGGKLKISSQSGKGCSITAIIPY